jgi:hypothetical protein
VGGESRKIEEATMPYASVVHVQLTQGGGAAAGEQMLREQLLPRLQAQPGFQNARFFRASDGTVGMGVAVFDTEEHANAGQDAMVNERPPEAPRVTSSAVYELFLEV